MRGNLKAYINIVIHNTFLGSQNFLEDGKTKYAFSVGGCRICGTETYSSNEDSLNDAKVLASAMTDKLAIIYYMGNLIKQNYRNISNAVLRSLLMGGCKTSISVNVPIKTEELEDSLDPNFLNELLGEYGKQVNKHGGYMSTGDDMNTRPRHYDKIREFTPFVFSHDVERDSDILRATGNPSIGTYIGSDNFMDEITSLVFRGESVKVIAIQGTGQVGAGLAKEIGKVPYYNKKTLILSDKKKNVALDLSNELCNRSKYPGIDQVWIVNPEDLIKEQSYYGIEIFSPNAGSNVINEENIHFYTENPHLKLVCGNANCQVQSMPLGTEEKLEYELLNVGIFHAPDPWVNFGGALHLTAGFPGREIISRDDMVKFSIKYAALGARLLASDIYRRFKEADEKIPPMILGKNVARSVITAVYQNWKERNYKMDNVMP